MVEEINVRWMSTADAAAALGLTADRVRQLISSGALDSHRVGGRYLVRRDDVDARGAMVPRPAAHTRPGARGR